MVVLDLLELGDAYAVIDAPLVVGDITGQGLVVSTCRAYGFGQAVHLAANKIGGESISPHE